MVVLQEAVVRFWLVDYQPDGQVEMVYWQLQRYRITDCMWRVIRCQPYTWVAHADRVCCQHPYRQLEGLLGILIWLWNKIGGSPYGCEFSTWYPNVVCVRCMVWHYGEPHMGWFHQQQNAAVYMWYNSPTCRLQHRVWLVYVWVQVVPLRIVLDYSVLRCYLIPESRWRLACVWYLFASSMLGDLAY